MTHEINIASEIPLSAEHKSVITRAVNRTLEIEGASCACEVDVLVTGDDEITVINADYRGKPEPTDVLSFPFIDIGSPEILRGADNCFEIVKSFAANGDYNPENGKLILGEIVISLERAKIQAAEIGQSLERELFFLVVHAMLHILGYDHEASDEDEKIMKNRQQLAVLEE